MSLSPVTFLHCESVSSDVNRAAPAILRLVFRSVSFSSFAFNFCVFGLKPTSLSPVDSRSLEFTFFYPVSGNLPFDWDV